MSGVEVKFLGSGDAFGSGGRFNTCIMVSGGGAGFLFDCGASSLVALRRFGVDPNSIGTILISHLHGDHFGGLPFFLLDARIISKRDRPLLIAGPPGLEKRVEDTMELLFPGSSVHEVNFLMEFLELEEGRNERLEGLEVEPYPAVHPSGAPSFILRTRSGGKTIVYTGDTEWCKGLTQAARDCDLLITECFTFNQNIGYHLNYRTLQARRSELGAKRIIYTHMGREMLARTGELEGEFAEDGKVFSV